MRTRIGAALGVLALLSGCGGGDGGGASSPIATAPTPTPSPSPTPTPATTAGCSLRERQDWAAAQLREWYLFPATLPASLDPTPYTTVDDYIDALTATARSQRKDRYFTYLTSIKEEDAYYNQGANAGFGLRFAADQTGRRVFVTEAFEGGPGLGAGIDRGAEITAIGTSTTNLRTVSDITAAQGLAGVSDAFGPDTAGTTRVLRFTSASGASATVTVTKTDFALLPVSTRYGVQVIDDGGRKVGYLNLRTFINTAEQPLRTAFASFRQQGITNVIVDFRYNGGGLLSTAELVGNLLGGARAKSDVFTYITYRPEKASNNETAFFAPQPESIAPTRIAFIGGGGTASASELVINGFVPYLGTNAGLIGSNTYGKPVGQIALDKPACDDRLRVIALALENSAHFGGYYDGLAGSVKASCKANDDILHPMGSPQETLTRAALDYLAGRSCSPITLDASAKSVGGASGPQTLLTPARPGTAQREVPGLF